MTAACWRSASVAGAFTDIITAGGSFVTGGYNGDDIDLDLATPSPDVGGVERHIRWLYHDDGVLASRRYGPNSRVPLAHGQRQQRNSRGLADRQHPALVRRRTNTDARTDGNADADADAEPDANTNAQSPTPGPTGTPPPTVCNVPWRV